jgi:hypothetical protein
MRPPRSSLRQRVGHAAPALVTGAVVCVTAFADRGRHRVARLLAATLPLGIPAGNPVGRSVFAACLFCNFSGLGRMCMAAPASGLPVSSSSLGALRQPANGRAGQDVAGRVSVRASRSQRQRVLLQGNRHLDRVRFFLRPIALLACALALAAAPVRAGAATISYFAAFNLPAESGNLPSLEAPFSVPKFDAALGTLNAINLAVARGGMQYTWALDNEVDVSTLLQAPVQLIARTSLSYLGDELAFVLSLNSFSPPPFVTLAADNDGAPDFVGSDAHTFQGVWPLATLTDAIVDPLLLDEFIGSGGVQLELSFSLTRLLNNTGCCIPVQLISLPATAAQWFWEYEYTPAVIDPGPEPGPSPVPEPATLLLVALGAAALGCTRRWRVGNAGSARRATKPNVQSSLGERHVA